MKSSRLVDVLATWGIHEGIGRLNDAPSKYDGPEGRLSGIDNALRYRSPLLARILAACPVCVLFVEIDAEDISLLRLADNRTIEEWKLAAPLDQQSYDYFRSIANTKDRIEGPLICTAQMHEQNRYAPPIFVFDGWHRLAAWSEHMLSQKYPITAYLILTKDAVPLLPSPPQAIGNI